VLDIQHMQQGREPWSKAKGQGSPSNGKEVTTQKKKAQSSAPGGRPAVAAKLRSRPLSLHSGHDATKILLKKIRTRALVGVLLLLGFVFGMRVIATRRHPVALQAYQPVTTAKRMTVAEAIAAGETMTTGEPVMAAHPVTPAEPVAAPRITTTPAPSAPRPRVIASLAKAATATDKDKAVKVQRAGLPAISPANPPAMLEIEVDHKFAAGQLSIWVDGQLTYQRRLEGADKKRLVVFHHVEGHELHAMQLSPGKHSIRVQVTSEAANYDQSATVAGEFSSGGENVLRINCSKPAINLSLQ